MAVTGPFFDGQISRVWLFVRQYVASRVATCAISRVGVFAHVLIFPKTQIYSRAGACSFRERAHIALLFLLFLRNLQAVKFGVLIFF